MKIIFQLFFQFFHIGVFSFGGGYATLPFLYNIADKFHWFSVKQLTDMIAVSSITPGPVGINMATFAGFSTMGVTGALLATFAIILPSYLIVSFVYKIMNKFRENRCIIGAVRALKPAGCALLAGVGIKLLFTSNLHLIGIIVFIVLLSARKFKKFDPIFYLGTSAIIGFIAGHFNWIGA